MYTEYTQKNLLCIHKRSLAHAQHSCRGQGPKKGRWPVPGPGPRLFWVPGPWGPWPRACTRVLCMHKRSLVYTQEILLCIHNKCINVTSVAMLRSYAELCETIRNYAKLCKTMRNYAKLFETILNYTKLCETIRNYTKLCETMRNYAKLYKTHACTLKV